MDSEYYCQLSSSIHVPFRSFVRVLVQFGPVPGLKLMIFQVRPDLEQIFSVDRVRSAFDLFHADPL